MYLDLIARFATLNHKRLRGSILVTVRSYQEGKKESVIIASRCPA